MSNPQQALAGIAGGVIGWFVGGPAGAAYGFQAGLLAGSILYPTQLPHVYGPRIEDMQVTNAQLGGAIPYIYGTVTVPGAVIYLGCPVEVSTTTELGGKGGPEQEQTTYTYFQTIALGLAETFDGLLRIWENGELKYDVREIQDGETDEDYAARLETSSEYAIGFTLYLGGEEQEPDPTLEAELGVGNVPAFRGLGYIVFHDRQLTDAQARRHPQFRFEIYKAVSTGPEVVFPEIITGVLTGSATHPMAVDYVRNRYWVIDSSSGAVGVRRFSLLTNTEVEQKEFADIVDIAAGTFLTLHTFTVDPRTGYLYFDYATLGGDGIFAKIDPTALESISWTPYNLSQATVGSCAFYQNGVQEIRGWLLKSLLLSNDLVLWSLDTMAPFASFAVSTGQQTHVVPGRRSGSNAYVYGIGWDLAASGTTGPIELHEVVVGEVEALGSYLPIAQDTIQNIQPADIVPTWTRFTQVSGCVWDQVDDTLIFEVSGHDATAGAGELYLVKYDPTAQEIVWAVTGDPGFFDEHILLGANVWLTRLRDNRLVLPTTSGGEFVEFDTRDGSYVTLDMAPYGLPNGLGNSAEYIYDSVFHAAVGLNTVDSEGWPLVFFDRRTPGRVSLADIVRDVWERCDGEETELNVEDLEERYVLGYTQTRPMPGRGLIEPLRPLGPFDQVESQGVLKFPTRGKAIVVTLAADELGAHDESAAPPVAVQVKALADQEMPRRLRVKYIARSRDYEPGDQLSPVRFTATPVNEKDVDIPAVITDEQAAQTAEILWAEAWIARHMYEIALDVEFLRLDPADCVGLPVDGRVYRARIVNIDDSSGGILRKMQLLRDDDGTYTSEAVADDPIRLTTALAIYSETGLILLDLPPLLDEDDNAGFYAAAYPLVSYRQWNGAVIHRSVDGGGAYGQIGSITNAATVGTLAEDLPEGITTVFDDANEIVVELISGAFESVTEDDLLENRANAVAIGAHGRWEIVQFQTATQETDTQWRLSHLLRGRRATEHNVGLGVTGDFVVLLAGGVSRLTLQIADIGVENLYRAVTIGATFGSSSPQEFTGDGESLKPFSPVDIEGERDGSNNLTITWLRRGRIGVELPSGADIPLSEETEAYEVDVLDDAVSPHTVLRTIEVTAETASYTAAQQTTDGLTPGDPVTVRIYQISATVGRGHYSEATI